ncbi:hypothetical protein AVEN_244038-1 [Araneus ventricosus]|uniref:Uncharacterized protein n=1 Tax=Araneus ventricosus TaxID=182803 RepID=A0A4Y2RQP0_ARAVE|nr:hypothetical protein AVEN_244038-1 [Araneus ventricosus]
MERIRDPLPTLQCPRNRPLWRRGLMVWEGIMLDGRTPLHVFERGTVTGVRYRDEILEPYVSLFRGEVGHEFILMDDNHIELFWSTNF